MNINLTLIGQMLAFVAFVVFCMKYVWPPILAAMQEREQKIAEGLAAAEQAEQDLELAKEKAVERLKEAKEEASSIVDVKVIGDCIGDDWWVVVADGFAVVQ